MHVFWRRISQGVQRADAGPMQLLCLVCSAAAELHIALALGGLPPAFRLREGRCARCRCGRRGSMLPANAANAANANAKKEGACLLAASKGHKGRGAVGWVCSSGSKEVSRCMGEWMGAYVTHLS